MDNSQLYCNVFFDYDKEVNDFIKVLYERDFMTLRDEAVELLNPHYEEWNAEYDRLYGEMDEATYNPFIQQKQREILKIVNDKHVKGPGISTVFLDSSDDECDIMAVSRLDGTKIHLTIKLINEKEWKEYWRNGNR